MRVDFELVKSKAEECATIRAVEKTADVSSAIELLEGIGGTLAVVKDEDKFLLKLGDIYYIESVDKHTYVYTKNECYETKYRLYELENMLGGYFARCSKAMIVNLKKVKNFRSEIGGRMNAVMLNDEQIIISRSYVKDIRRRLGV